MLACYGVLWLYDKIQQYVYYYISLFSAESESGRFRSFAFIWADMMRLYWKMKKSCLYAIPIC